MRRRHLSSAEVARCESGSWSPARTIASISPSAYLPDIALATFRSLAIGTLRTGSAYAVGRSRTPVRRPRNRRRAQLSPQWAAPSAHSKTRVLANSVLTIGSKRHAAATSPGSPKGPRALTRTATRPAPIACERGRRTGARGKRPKLASAKSGAGARVCRIPRHDFHNHSPECLGSCTNAGLHRPLSG
jgi:hypothetical protein